MDKRTQKVRFEFTASQNNYDFTLQNASIDFRLERFQDDLQALSGKMIQQVAGWRLYVDINYDASLEMSDWRTFCNALRTEFVVNQVDSVSVYFSNSDGTFSGADDADMIVTSDSMYRINMSNQINTFVPSITLKEVDRRNQIPSWYLF